MRLELSEAADNDLEEILAYSRLRFGDPVAVAYVASFDDAFDRLVRHPYAGAAADLVTAGIRRLSHRQHRIFYQIEDDRILIIRVLHHAMSLEHRLDG